MFDVGFAEILLLSLIGLLVLGPERLPRVARTLGGMARKARASWMSLKQSIDAEIRAEELKKPLKQFENEIRSTTDQIKSKVDSFSDFDPVRGTSRAKAEPEPGTTSDSKTESEPAPDPKPEARQADDGK